MLDTDGSASVLPDMRRSVDDYVPGTAVSRRLGGPSAGKVGLPTTATHRHGTRPKVVPDRDRLAWAFEHGTTARDNGAVGTQ